MKKIGLGFCFIMLLATPGFGQLYKTPTKIPKAEFLSTATRMVERLFKNLEEGKTEEIANWLVEQLGSSWNEAKRIQDRNDFKSKLDIIVAGPPASSYGKLAGYDLLEESYLPGSDRYFRFTYLSYHQEAPLVWEFRFYAKPDGGVSLNSVTWSDKNPFEYLSTSDMLLNVWYAK